MSSFVGAVDDAARTHERAKQRVDGREEKRAAPRTAAVWAAHTRGREGEGGVGEEGEEGDEGDEGDERDERDEARREREASWGRGPCDPQRRAARKGEAESHETAEGGGAGEERRGGRIRWSDVTASGGGIGAETGGVRHQRGVKCWAEGRGWRCCAVCLRVEREGGEGWRVRCLPMSMSMSLPSSTPPPPLCISERTVDHSASSVSRWLAVRAAPDPRSAKDIPCMRAVASVSSTSLPRSLASSPSPTPSPSSAMSRQQGTGQEAAHPSHTWASASVRHRSAEVGGCSRHPHQAGQSSAKQPCSGVRAVTAFEVGSISQGGLRGSGCLPERVYRQP